MTVQETLNALGQWDIDLRPTIPREKLDALKFFGHIAIIHGRIDPATYGDSLLNPGVARYVGVLRTNSLADDARTKIPNDNVKIGGVGMAMWLGDQDNKGDVIENSTVFATGSLFPDVVRALLPASGAVTEGTLYPVAGTYSGAHQWQSPRQAIQYVCDTMSTPGVPVNWRVNNNATLDAGPESNLFVTTPQATVVARGDGEDMSMRGIPGSMDLTSDVEDFTTRVVMLAEGEGASIVTDSADLGPSNPYKDLHGHAVKLTRLVSESATTAPNVLRRAGIALRQYTSPKQDLRLSIQDYDTEGSFSVGDWIYAYDPDKGLVDPSVEITFRGQRLNPIRIQVTEIQWPVTADYTVAYRAADGTWTDLTDHIEINAAGTYVTVGGFARQLIGGGEPVGSRPNADTSTPGVPVLVQPFRGTAYLDSRGFTRSRVVITWTAPNNTDGSSVRDGDHYDIRYAVDTSMIYPATWSQVSQIRWQDMQTWAQPFAAPTGQWQTMAVGWDQATAQLQDLSPGVGYDVQIRAVDSSGNMGAWSPTTTFVATQDNIPPSTPAAPSVAASRIAVQVTHTLGKATGGTFNLESDLDHLEVHAQYEPAFTPTATTLLGKLKANAGMIQAGIAAVGTYGVESTVAVYVKCVAVDIAGNRSAPSVAVSSTALLIDDAHISDLTVSKVTAGTITASWVMAGEIKTADTGARARLSSSGIELYDATGTRTLFGSAADGSLSMIGQLSSASSGRRVVVNPSFNPEIRFYADSGPDFSYVNAFTVGTLTGIGINSAAYVNGSDTLGNRIVAYPSSGGVVMQTIVSATQAAKGGVVQVNPDSANMSWQDGATTGGLVSANATAASIGFGTGGGLTYMDSVSTSIAFNLGNAAEQTWIMDGFNSSTQHYGKWPNFVDTGSHAGLFTGHATAAAGTGITVLFGATRLSSMNAVVTCAASAYPSTGPAWAVNSSPSTTSFSVGWNTSLSAMQINYWCFRT